MYKSLSLIIFSISLSACSSSPKLNNQDYCEKILSGTSGSSPHISARKEKGSWEYTVPIKLTRNNTCKSGSCYSGNFVVNSTQIDTEIIYGGSLGNNNIEVKYSYLGRKASGSGKCLNNEINYNYIFTEGPPKGKKGVAKIYLK